MDVMHYPQISFNDYIEMIAKNRKWYIKTFNEELFTPEKISKTEYHRYINTQQITRFNPINEEYPANNRYGTEYDKTIKEYKLQKDQLKD
jgi:hypothetical protein